MTLSVTPYDWIRKSRQVAVLWFLFVAMAIIGAALDGLGPPGGWIPLEFPALYDERAANRPECWTATERETALFGLGLDYLFLIIYPLFLSLFLERAGRKWDLSPGLARLCQVFGPLVLLAAPLDALENAGLYWLVRGETAMWLKWFITAVAAPKWIIALAALGLTVVCLGIRIYRRVAKK